MAYNPNMYMPNQNYQPSWYYTPSITQPINGLVSVTGIEGAKAYQLPPNSSMPLFDANEDMLYVKTTDAAGYPTIKAFAFQPIQGEQPSETEYVPRSEFDALVEKVNKLTPKTHVRKEDDDE